MIAGCGFDDGEVVDVGTCALEDACSAVMKSRYHPIFSCKRREREREREREEVSSEREREREREQVLPDLLM